jgi:hypothetical protein
MGYYCEVCKWFLTDEAFNRRPKLPNQKEQLAQIRAISREVKEMQNDFYEKWGITLSKKFRGFGSFI